MYTTATQTYPINEIFGPTIQGEGPEIGKRVLFIRFAGCDWDCDWCDTKYAVGPKYPGWSRTMMSLDEIVERLQERTGKSQTSRVVLSGGNPALFTDVFLLDHLVEAGYLCSMETQGSVFGDWVAHRGLRTLVVSPKPPSSGMEDRFAPNAIKEAFNVRARKGTFNPLRNFLKFVVLDAADIDWVKKVDRVLAGTSCYKFLSIGTNPELTVLADVRRDILARARNVINTVGRDPFFADYTILPQMHTLIYGQIRGV